MTTHDGPSPPDLLLPCGTPFPTGRPGQAVGRPARVGVGAGRGGDDHRDPPRGAGLRLPLGPGRWWGGGGPAGRRGREDGPVRVDGGPRSAGSTAVGGRARSNGCGRRIGASGRRSAGPGRRIVRAWVGGQVALLGTEVVLQRALWTSLCADSPTVAPSSRTVRIRPSLVLPSLIVSGSEPRPSDVSMNRKERAGFPGRRCSLPDGGGLDGFGPSTTTEGAVGTAGRVGRPDQGRAVQPRSIGAPPFMPARSGPRRSPPLDRGPAVHARSIGALPFMPA